MCRGCSASCPSTCKQQRSLRRNLVLPLGEVIIRNGSALRDIAHAPDDARAREHRLAERPLAGRRVTHDSKIPKIPCRRCDHNSDSFPAASNLPRAQAEISGSLRGRCGRTSRLWRAEIGSTESPPPSSQRRARAGLKMPAQCWLPGSDAFAASIGRGSIARAPALLKR